MPSTTLTYTQSEILNLLAERHGVSPNVMKVSFYEGHSDPRDPEDYRAPSFSIAINLPTEKALR